MFYELKTPSSMVKIQKSDISIKSLIDVFGKEYLIQEIDNPISLCKFDGEDFSWDKNFKAITAVSQPRVLYSNDKRISAMFKSDEGMVSVSYNIDEDGLGTSFMTDSEDENGMCILLKLYSFSCNENGSDYRMITAANGMNGFTKVEDGISVAELKSLSDSSVEISSAFNGNGAEISVTGTWDIYAKAGNETLEIALVPKKKGEQLAFKLNMV